MSESGSAISEKTFASIEPIGSVTSTSNLSFASAGTSSVQSIALRTSEVVQFLVESCDTDNALVVILWLPLLDLCWLWWFYKDSSFSLLALAKHHDCNAVASGIGGWKVKIAEFCVASPIPLCALCIAFWKPACVEVELKLNL